MVVKLRIVSCIIQGVDSNRMELQDVLYFS